MLQNNAIKLSPQNPLTWPYGIWSPLCTNNRIVHSNLKIRKHINAVFGQLVKRFLAVDAIVSVAATGIVHDKDQYQFNQVQNRFAEIRCDFETLSDHKSFVSASQSLWMLKESKFAFLKLKSRLT